GGSSHSLQYTPRDFQKVLPVLHEGSLCARVIVPIDVIEQAKLAHFVEKLVRICCRVIVDGSTSEDELQPALTIPFGSRLSGRLIFDVHVGHFFRAPSGGFAVSPTALRRQTQAELRTVLNRDLSRLYA